MNERLIIKNILIWLLAILFLISSTTKLIALDVLKDEVLLYLEIYFDGWLSGYSLYVALIVCIVELAFGLMMSWRKTRMTALVLSSSLLLLFTYLTGENYFNPSIVGPIETCGCFGELIHFTPLWSFVKSAVLLCMSVSLFFFDMPMYE